MVSRNSSRSRLMNVVPGHEQRRVGTLPPIPFEHCRVPALCDRGQCAAGFRRSSTATAVSVIAVSPIREPLVSVLVYHSMVRYVDRGGSLMKRWTIQMSGFAPDTYFVWGTGRRTRWPDRRRPRLRLRHLSSVVGDLL